MSFDNLARRITEINAKFQTQFPEGIAMLAMAETVAEWKKRIFDKGQNSQGAPIGDGYSKEPAYFSKDQFVRTGAFKPQGKDPNDPKKAVTKRTTVFDIGTQKKRRVSVKNDYSERKSMYLPGGYEEFRRIQKRGTDFVNLKLSGSMEGGFRIVLLGNEVAFGNTDKNESKKIEGLNKRFGEWSEFSEFEKEYLKKSLAQVSTKVISND